MWCACFPQTESPSDLSRWLVMNYTPPPSVTSSVTPRHTLPLGELSAVSADKENSTVSTSSRVCSPTSQTGSNLPLIRASQSVCRQILLLNRGVKGDQ